MKKCFLNFKSFSPSFFHAFSEPGLNYCILKMALYFYFKTGVDDFDLDGYSFYAGNED